MRRHRRTQTEPKDGLSHMIARAIRDAQQGADATLRAEAQAWLWVCCPDIADQLELPAPSLELTAAALSAYAVRLN